MTTRRQLERLFEDEAAQLQVLGSKLEDLLLEILHSKQISFHRVSFRVKSFSSASKKVSSSDGKYNSISDLHDLLGIRVITHLSSDVGLVSIAVRELFEIDEGRSVSKQDLLDADRFGYISEHLLAKIDVDRGALPEWQRFAGITFEIQVRSILQHAWAEIEHDLGYKSPTAIPAQVRRRFARLAGLLELADSEFDAVSSDAATHQTEVQSSLDTGGSEPIDRDSILALLQTNEIIGQVDQKIAELIGADLDEPASNEYAETRASELLSLGLSTTQDVADAVSRWAAPLAQFAASWLTAPEPTDDESIDTDEDRDELGKYHSISAGISLFYLFLHLAAEDPTKAEALDSVGPLSDPERRRGFFDLHAQAFGEESSLTTS
ncbi:hypothetical protein PUY80_12585 [Plantibacter flavus]|uniref:GTP pyrophosphokinase n=1 Tax=Plantibacter flavus TaxID=150123 RepID=UPI002378F900|nr:hypothetical protein [Plantibacter flavus]MDD9153406.1 hypothetical protein [Plantibacter flavus]